MSKAMREKLSALNKDALIEMLLNIANENKDTKKLVSLFMAAHDPKEMYKTLNKQVTGIKNAKRFISYYEANAFTAELESILDKIDNYLAEQAPELAIKLCNRFIEIDAALFERVDDSNGCLGDFYYDLFKVLDKAFSFSKEAPKAIAETIISVYFNDAYGNRGSIIDNLNLCLAEPVIQALEAALPLIKTSDTSPELDRSHLQWDFDAYMENDRIISIHKKIADKRKNVDRYIELVQLSNVNDKDICQIAKRLNDAFRSVETITWLKRISEDSFESYTRDKLLIEAYMLEGDTKQAKLVLWNSFKKTLAVETYLAYLKLADLNEKKHAAEEIFNIIQNSSNLASGFKLLHDLGKYNAIERLYFARENEIDAKNYSTYRKLSTELHKQGKSLIAALLRRKLINEVLASARSKSYRYAASDLKLAGDFSENVTDWMNYPSHAEYIYP